MFGKNVYVLIFLTSFIFSIGYYINTKIDVQDFCYSMINKLKKIKKLEEENLRNYNNKHNIVSPIETDSDSELEIIVEDSDISH